MAQGMERLLCKHKSMNSNLSPIKKKKKKRENLVEEQETFQQTMVFFVVSYYRSIWEIKEQHLLIRRFGEICSFNKYLLNTCKGPVLSGWVVSAQR
jgi:hypothetical protein